MNKLFDEYIRKRETQNTESESQYHFYNTSSWPRIYYIRELLNSWYDEFPKNKDFFQRFTSDKSDQHSGALFELFIYTIFRKLNFEVEYAQHLANGRNIDLRILSQSIEIHLDCKVGIDEDELGLMDIKKSIVDKVDSTKPINFYICPEFIKSGNTTPKLSKIEKELRAQFTREENGFDYRYVANGWEIRFRFIRKSTPNDVTIGHLSYFNEGKFFEFSSMNNIRNDLGTKRGTKYGVGNKYVIAYNSQDSYLMDYLIYGALYGQAMLNEYSHIYLKNAFFIQNGKPQNTSVSAIIIVKNLYLATLNKPEIQIWHNPWSKYPISLNVFPFKSFIPIIKQKEFIGVDIQEPVLSTNDILGIKNDHLDF